MSFLGFKEITQKPYHLFKRKVTGETETMAFFESDDEAQYMGSALTIKALLQMIPRDDLLTSRYIIVTTFVRGWEPV